MAAVVTERAVTPGLPVPELWTPVTRPEPFSAHGPTRKLDDTRTSDAAPVWMTHTNSVPANTPAEWDWITQDRKAHRRQVVRDDTETSFDAPVWFRQELKATGAPRPTRHFDRYTSSGGKQLHLKPLVEEMHGYGTEGAHHRLHPVKSTPGYVPSRELREVLDSGSAAPRGGLTTSTIIGGGQGAGADFAPRRPRTVDRMGLTSAADMDNLDGPIVDPFGGTAQAGEATRHAARARSVGARSHALQRGGGGTVGGAHEGLPLRELPGRAVLVREAPHATYYAWKRATYGDEAVFGAPGLNRGRPPPSHGELAGHARYYALVNTFATAPGQHLGAIRSGLQETMKRSGTAPSGDMLRQAPMNWYTTCR